MKFTKIPADTFKMLQMNAGILLANFTPATGVYSEEDILGATKGGVNFSATPTYSDFGEDIDNCPKNTKELKRLDGWEATMGGAFVTSKTALAKQLVAAADIDTQDATKVTPRNDLADADFSDISFVGDYSDKNGVTNGGFIAIRLINALSTGGFQMQTSDKSKSEYAFTFTGHYSIAAQGTVPFEIYIKSGTAEA